MLIYLGGEYILYIVWELHRIQQHLCANIMQYQEKILKNQKAASPPSLKETGSHEGIQTSVAFFLSTACLETNFATMERSHCWME